MKKPRIRIGWAFVRIWFCEGRGVTGVAITPIRAYEAWERKVLRMVAHDLPG